MVKFLVIPIHQQSVQQSVQKRYAKTAYLRYQTSGSDDMELFANTIEYERSNYMINLRKFDFVIDSFSLSGLIQLSNSWLPPTSMDMISYNQ